MKVFELLENSTFGKEGGKVLFRAENGKWSIKTLYAKAVDEKIPYRFLNPLQTLFFLTYNGGNAVVSAPTSSGKSLLAYLFFRNFKGSVREPKQAFPSRGWVKPVKVFGEF